MIRISDGPSDRDSAFRTAIDKTCSPWTGLGRDCVNIIIANDIHGWVFVLTGFGFATKGIPRRSWILLFSKCPRSCRGLVACDVQLGWTSDERHMHFTKHRWVLSLRPFQRRVAVVLMKSCTDR